MLSVATFNINSHADSGFVAGKKEAVETVLCYLLCSTFWLIHEIVWCVINKSRLVREQFSFRYIRRDQRCSGTYHIDITPKLNRLGDFYAGWGLQTRAEAALHIIKCETPLSRPLFPWRAPGKESRRQAFHFKAVLTERAAFPYVARFCISDFLCTCPAKHSTRRPPNCSTHALTDRRLFFCPHFSVLNV